MNKLPSAKRAQILNCLVEGMSIRATTRVCDVSKNTVVKLLCDAGRACSAFQDEALRDLTCQRVQVDEIWAFVGMKQKNVPEDKKGQLGYGDTWTWVALCADTKLIPSWFVGARDAEHARAFLADLHSRLANRVQLTSDGWRAYTDAVSDIFLDDVDYAQLVKIYGETLESEKRYSPAVCLGAHKQEMIGNPDRAHISTSFVERSNLTMRMNMRRFTRLTNAFSKKIENHVHAVSLHFMYYNFCRIHQSLRVTPAMAAGVTDRLFDVADIVRIIDEYETAETDGTDNQDLTKLREDAKTFNKESGLRQTNWNRIGRQRPNVVRTRRNPESTEKSK